MEAGSPLATVTGATAEPPLVSKMTTAVSATRKVFVSSRPPLVNFAVYSPASWTVPNVSSSSSQSAASVRVKSCPMTSQVSSILIAAFASSVRSSPV